jgi:hypothetical protein
MKCFGVEMPDWLRHKLNTEYGPHWSLNAVLGLLLDDFIKRHGPKPLELSEVTADELNDLPEDS